jgi:DNA polymerase-3 subunit epsilon
MDAPVRDLHFVAFDTETTGLLPTVDRVLEIAAVRFTLDGTELATFDELIHPGRSIPKSASRVHGIDDDAVVGKPPIEEVLPRFTQFVRDSVLIAHNAEFDVLFLGHEIARGAPAMPRSAVLDSVEISRSLRPDLPNHKLETISKAIGLEAPTYHRALADAQTLAAVFCKMLPEARTAGSWQDLLGLVSGALTFHRGDQLRMWLPPHLKALEDAFDTEGKVTILYEPEGKRSDTRDIRPRAYMRRTNGTFLMAYCERDKADRSFRLDWITRAQYAQASLF